jgi:hypothetical protein
VTGQAMFSGTLKLLLLDGFVPGDFETFQFIDAGSLSASFTTLDLPPLPDGRQWDPSALASGRLSTTPEPGGLAFVSAGILMLRPRRHRPLRAL